MHRTVALWAALAVFGAGLVYRIAGWFRHGIGGESDGPASARLVAAVRGTASILFSRSITTVVRSFVADVLLQRRLRAESVTRWVVHLTLSTAFLLLVVLHALGAFVFRGYVPTLNPFLFLRDLLGAALLIAVLAAAYRRHAARDPRRATSPSDWFALTVVIAVAASGVLLEATQIGSLSTFRRMAAEYAPGASTTDLQAYWAAEMGTVAPGPRPDADAVARGAAGHAARCAACHSPARGAFLGYGTAAVLRPIAPALDAAGAPAFLGDLHFLAVLIGLAYLPFSKLFHVFATPLVLIVNAAAPRRAAGPNHDATRQALELDACTHCATCSAQCSTAMASVALGDPALLPSERMRTLRKLAADGSLSASELRALQEGVYLCTGCERCTVRCPSGIDVQGLWAGAREALLARGEPAYALLSPLAFRRAMQRDALEPARYRDGFERPRRALEARFGRDRGGGPLTPGDERCWRELHRSLQASTFSRCFGCKTCSTACPVARADVGPEPRLDLLPHQVLHAVRLRLWDVALGSRLLWDCLGCYQCQEHCPQGVQITDVLYQLKNIAIAQARAGAAVAAAPRDGATA